MNVDVVLKALQCEIERAEHQMSNCRGNTPYEKRKKYLRGLYDMAAEIQLLGIQEEDRERD